MKEILGKLHGWCNKHEYLILYVAAVILLRIPTLVTPHYYGDEEIYFVMGRAWSEGVPLYQAIFDHKPPLIYILAGLAKNVFWFRMMLLTTMAVHTILFYQLAMKVWGKARPILPHLSTLIFVVLTTLPTFEGNIANAELFMMLPITASLLMVLPTFGKNRTGKPYYAKYPASKYLMAGLVAGVGWLFKVPVAADFAALALFIFVVSEPTVKQGIKNIFSGSFWLYIGGFAAPLASTFAYYFLKGHGPSYLDTVLTINLSYVSSWSTAQFEFNPFASGLVNRGIILLAFGLFIYIFRKKIDKRVQLLGLWLVFSFFGALLSGRPYPHYLQQPFVPLSLLVPAIFLAETVLTWVLLGAILMWGVLAHKQIKFWAYDTMGIYKTFWAQISGRMSEQEYIYSFDGARRNYLIADYLNERMGDNDKLYVWGSDAAIYNLTDTLPSGGKFMVNFHVHDFKAENEVIKKLEDNKPRFIVVLADSTEFPQLEVLLDHKYIATYEVDSSKVYMRVQEIDAFK